MAGRAVGQARAQLDWPVPDYSTVCRRQKTLQAQISYRPSTQPLQQLIDSTGFKFLGEGEWKRKKLEAEYRREWRKVRLGIDARTLEIRAVEVTSNAIGDAPMLPQLLAQIPPDEPIASVLADGAYDTRGCLNAIAQRGAVAVIPPRKNASLQRRPSPGAESRNEAVRARQRLGEHVTMMDDDTVVRSLGALSQVHRLRAFRALVEAGHEGLPLGMLAEQLGISPASMSFHLKELLYVDLVTQTRDGRNLVYRASFDRMNGVLDFLTSNCCEGQPCELDTPSYNY